MRCVFFIPSWQSNCNAHILSKVWFLKMSTLHYFVSLHNILSKFAKSSPLLRMSFCNFWFHEDITKEQKSYQKKDTRLQEALEMSVVIILKNDNIEIRPVWHCYVDIFKASNITTSSKVQGSLPDIYQSLDNN